ncbi:MAG: hypothetical protein EBZ48_00045 [Proteobacteria bacterium]|nr:hypothetical protein [Pseudomonadota bacterium]
MKEVLEQLKPQPCPYPMIRIGGACDGSYLIPDDLDGISSCFSPGVNNFKTFEDELTLQHSIKCHMCDFSSDANKLKTPLIDGLQTFKKKWLDIDNAPDSISLMEWIEELDPEPTNDLILQIDIEGAEYRNLLNASPSTLNRFRIIVIEFHDFHVFGDPLLLSEKVEPLIRKLHESHKPVHAHPNNCCGEIIEKNTGMNIPNVIEVTYLRNDRFLGDPSKFNTPQIPHPLDIGWNVRWHPPLHLNSNWLENGKRSRESELKIYSDELEFANWSKDQSDHLNKQNTQDLNKVYQDSINNLANLLADGQMHEALASIDSIKIDYAIGKRFFLSESFADFPAEGLVSNDKDFFFHTAFGHNQSITIDMEALQRLQLLVIKNRKDMCQDRAVGLFYILHNERSYDTLDSLPVRSPVSFLSPFGEKSVTPLYGAVARYLTIFSPIKTALHFSAICIY